MSRRPAKNGSGAPPAKRAKAKEVPVENDRPVVVRPADDAEIAYLASWISPTSAELALKRQVQDNPNSIQYWREAIYSYGNMSVIFRKRVEELNKLVKDSADFKEDERANFYGHWRRHYDENYRDREQNLELDDAIKHWCRSFESYIDDCITFLDRGEAKLAQNCANLLMRLYIESSGEELMEECLSGDEQSELFESFISFHEKFIASDHVTPAMIKSFNSEMAEFCENLPGYQDVARLEDYLSECVTEEERG